MSNIRAREHCENERRPSRERTEALISRPGHVFCVTQGDASVKEGSGGALNPYDPEVEEALAVAGKGAGRYCKALRELAQ